MAILFAGKKAFVAGVADDQVLFINTIVSAITAFAP